MPVAYLRKARIAAFAQHKTKRICIPYESIGPSLNVGQVSSRAGFGHSCGQSGRNTNRRSMPTTAKKKTINDHVFYLGSSQAASDYQRTQEYLINHTCKTYTKGDDIATALEDLKEFNYNLLALTPIFSGATDSAVAAQENEVFLKD